jgi:hypothetical protein
MLGTNGFGSFNLKDWKTDPFSPSVEIEQVIRVSLLTI